MPLSQRPRYKSKTYAGASTIANSSVATDFALQHVIKANTLKLGKTYRVTGYAIYSTLAAAPGSAVFAFKLGSTTIATTGSFTASANKVNAQVSFDILMNCLASGVSGTAEVQGRLFNETGNGVSQPFSMENTAPITIDTTVDQTLKLTFQWGSADAANTITLRLLEVEELG